MSLIANTQAVFHQLAREGAAADLCVKSIIENHDAWLHAPHTSAALRLKLVAQPRSAATTARILQQQRTLAPLVTHLPARCSSAG